MTEKNNILIISENHHLVPKILRVIENLDGKKSIISDKDNPAYEGAELIKTDFSNPAEITRAVTNVFAQTKISHVILSLNPPKQTPNLIKEEDLMSMREAILRYNDIIQSILHNFKDNQVHLIVNLNIDFQNPLTNLIFNNYALGILEGLRIEMHPYKPIINAIYAKFDDYDYEYHLKRVINLSKQSKLVNNLSRKFYQLHVLNKKPIIKNRDTRVTRIKSPVAIITGASGGIGKEIAYLLADNNWKVYSLSRKAIEDSKIVFLECNVKDANAVAVRFQEIYEKHNCINLVINNSGYGIAGSLEMMNSSLFKDMLDLNTFAALRIIKIAVPYLSKCSGRIFNIGSIAGLFAIPFQAGYALTKTLIDAYTEMLMPILNKENIQICNIMPGDTKTNFSNTRAKNKFFNLEQKYEARANASIAKMEKDELHGHSPVKVAKTLYRELKKRNMNIKVAVGLKYKLLGFLATFLDPKMIEDLLYSMYAKNE
ncbi:SDR family NAD(P)-dependent oxidoreductase [[Mycoplasma] testudinis]|uniref:SDR family NAD(P)-dependent oxidoreductase n=1 Tax=[Mycoplasma] testudinis TaxID=33924 RepID=UPI00048846E1|nr:SDR family NAD(P)-dependent oxidoreductase [[Mycoplasma] testudinis]